MKMNLTTDTINTRVGNSPNTHIFDNAFHKMLRWDNSKLYVYTIVYIIGHLTPIGPWPGLRYILYHAFRCFATHPNA